MRIFRLFRLMDTLRLRTVPVTARALADEMGVSIRSIYRDIADLQSLGAPIRGEGGIGYVMERGYFVPSLGFDSEELDAISMGLQLVAERSSDSLSAAAGRATAKIASAIGEARRRDLLETPLYDQLRKAIKDRDVLRIEYLSVAGKRSSRIAHPLGLTAFDDTWLLTIWCESAEDFRHLRLDHIQKIEPTGTRFHHERGRRFADALARERDKMTAGNPARSV